MEDADIAELKKEARRYGKAGQHEKAIECYERILEK